MALVFVPLSTADLRAWATDGQLAGRHRGYAVTPAMIEAFGTEDPEDAEYAALCIASVAGLLAHGERIVAVAAAPVVPTADDFGEVEVVGLPYTAVSALFGEDPDPTAATTAVERTAGLSLAEAWDAPVVQAMLADSDLLWYGPAEWGDLVQG